MFIPAICASYGNVKAVSQYKVNYYIGNGVSAKKSFSFAKEYKDIVESGCDIIMVHAIVPDNISDFYDANKPYFELLRKLGKIGLTVHYVTPRNHEEENLLFIETLRIHKELPEATLYVESVYNNVYGTFLFVKSLKDLSIDAWMLLDTCHLEMDLCQYKDKRGDYRFLFNTFKDYIGAFHVSASKLYEGYNPDTHGKPIYTAEDEIFFRKLCEDIVSVDYGHDVILVPEVTEERYGKRCERSNGKYAMKIMEDVLNKNKY